MKKILFIALICTILSYWTSAQNNLVVETKQMDTITIDILKYDNIVVFDYNFCSACYEKDYSQSPILMVYYNKNSLSKIDRVKIYKSMKKIYKNAEVYFFFQALPKGIKVNVMMPTKEFPISE
ncbi:MAG: hypothetical protein Q4Q06_07385 [Bacteroidota bacterium]|nr:hypothetical protein [Bacteroidota bacterium]